MKYNLMAKKSHKQYWVPLAAIVVLSAVLFFFKFDLPSAGTGQSYVSVSFGDNLTRKFEGEVSRDMTILGAVYAASLTGDFEFRYSIDKNGEVHIAKIGDTINSPDMPNWLFYLNGKLVRSGDIDQVKIRAGDLIEARYESI